MTVSIFRLISVSYHN